jgi:hypothetical protein
MRQNRVGRRNYWNEQDNERQHTKVLRYATQLSTLFSTGTRLGILLETGAAAMRPLSYSFGPHR